CIDYPEEDIEEQTKEQLTESISALQKKVQDELNGYDGGRIRREGARVTLTGKTNAGKSTLFNTLLGCDRAIVSDEEGTTRDTLEEKMRYKDASFVLIDTAGLRETQNRVEQMGIERSLAAKRKADAVVHVVRKGEKFDESLDENAVLVINSLQTDCTGGKTTVRVGKKEAVAVELNARTGIGAEILCEELYRIMQNKTQSGGNVNNPRQYEALQEAAKCLERAQTAVHTLTMDCVCSDLSEAVRALGRITGKNASESIIGEIFSHFCVGK
ncbi:MAG: 50S ribosome-binding GTPase, partial [Clostridiales bacterium]|nr:50S ribosome-binding GTPase [Clostridiales bacterium]